MAKGKVWVLDTETKGTGAQMVPLDQRVRDRSGGTELVVVEPHRPRKVEHEPEPKRPRRFKVVDVVSGDVLAEGAGARATVDLLKTLRSVVDVRMYVWEDTTSAWRLLTLGEQRAMWALRERLH
jgi:hypothetical protein